MKFALHGGYVRSRNDGDTHWVPAHRLIQLYELRPGEFIFWPRPGRSQGMDTIWDEYRHLAPRSDGRYGRPRS
jgi:hypothetical protein